LNLKLTLLVL
jgi:hypothetical protein